MELSQHLLSWYVFWTPYLCISHLLALVSHDYLSSNKDLAKEIKQGIRVMTKVNYLLSHMAQVKSIECITPSAKKQSICRKWLSYTVPYPQFWHLGCWFCFERWVGSTPHFRVLEFWHFKLQVVQLFLSLKLLILFKHISRLVF